MKKTFFVLLIAIIILTLISFYYVHNIRKIETLSQKNNRQYEQYCNKPILGAELISLINKAIDSNEKNEVVKHKGGIYYEDNNTNSIIITVNLIDESGKLNKAKVLRMEKILQKGSEKFIEFFSNEEFECTKVEYHENTQYIKSLHFEQKQN